jgi:RNA recognition motif-containing protein
MADQDPNVATDGKAEETTQEAVPVDPSSLKAPRVYVGNLAFSVGWQDLKDFFRERIGEVSRVEIISYPSGRSKGCAIVEFASVEDAARAINECSNEEIQGRKIFLREDREEKGFSTRGQAYPGFQPQYQGRGGAMAGGYQRGPSIYNQAARGGFAPRGRGGYAGGAAGQYQADPSYQRGPPPPTGNNDGTQVYVGNLPWRTSWQELKDLGAQFGDVHRSDVATDRFTGRSKGFGTLKFASPEAAQAAIEALNDSEFQGRKIVVRLDNYA